MENPHEGKQTAKAPTESAITIKPIKLIKPQIIEFSLLAHYSTTWEMQSRGVYQDFQSVLVRYEVCGTKREQIFKDVPLKLLL